MEKYEIKNIKNKIKLHNIVFSVTSEIDYEMSRFILLEDFLIDILLKPVL